MYAQSGTITVKGNVKDNNGEPIISGSVVVKGTTNGVVTDLDGNYELNNVPSNGTLIFTYLGFKTVEVPVVGKFQIDVTMEEDAVMLGDVIAVGYATGSKHTISGAIQKISKEDMNVGVINNPLDALKGKVAGVNISKVGGDPTAGTSIRVRGTTSLSGGNDPLVIIDGVFGDLGLLNALSPADIESFTILKDASETAQYGSRGASGVIVVTTAKGKYGIKTLSYDGTFGIESVYKNIKMLSADQYRQTVKDLGLVNAIDGGANTNFLEEMQQTGYTQNHRVAFGGGTEDSNYRASLGIIDQKGIIKNNWMKNYTAKIDVNQFFFDKKLQIEMGMFGSKKDQRYVNNYQKTFYSAASFNPTLPAIQNTDGTWAEDINANEVDNPLGRLTINDKENNAYLNAHAKLTWTIIEGLKFSAFGSYIYNSKENSKYVPINIKEGIREKGLAYRALNNSDILMGNLSLNYKKRMGVHAIDFLGLVEGQNYKYHGYTAQSRGFGTDYFGSDNLAGGALVKYGDVSSYRNGYDIFSLLGRFNYIYNDRYIATVNLRGDGSSKLGDNNKWGFFPSASLAWNMSEEEFIKNISAISNLKLRVGYGVTGNQDAISAYNSLQLMGPTGLVTVNGNPAVSYGYLRNPNPDLKWETKKMFDAGFDLSLLNKKIDLTFDFYYSKTSDLLYNYTVPVPPFIHPTLLANMGEMENRGIELAVSVTPINTKDIGLTVSANGAYQKNKLLSLSGVYNGQEINAATYMALGGISGAGSIGGDNNVIYQMVNQPLGVFYLPKATGIINDGFDSYSYNILDLDNDGSVNTAEGKDRYIAGQAIPKFFLGSNINFRYKDFDIQTQLNGAFGHKIFNGTSLTYMNMSNFPTYNVLPDAPSKNIRDNRVSDYWLEKGDYLNIAYVTIGYNINTSKINKYIKTMRITASVNNLHTFTSYKGLSPMINSSTVGGELGVDDKRFYPLSRTYSIGLNINF
jgi:TonB-linked SusC/RagA family outer membrane protein